MYVNILDVLSVNSKDSHQFPCNASVIFIGLHNVLWVFVVINWQFMTYKNLTAMLVIHIFLILTFWYNKIIILKMMLCIFFWILLYHFPCIHVNKDCCCPNPPKTRKKYLLKCSLILIEWLIWRMFEYHSFTNAFH